MLYRYGFAEVPTSVGMTKANLKRVRFGCLPSASK